MPDRASQRIRVTVSLSKELLDVIDEQIDGLRVRNRSHAVESLLTDSLQVAQVREAVILAGGEHAPKRLNAIEHILKTLREYGIFEVTIAVGYLGDTIRKHLGDGRELGMSIMYAQSDLGTAGALYQLRSKLKSTFFVVNIDRPVEVDLKNLVKFHREHAPQVTIATKSLRDLLGVYVMEPRVLQSIPKGFCMLEETVFHNLTKQGKLLAYPVLTDK